MSDRFTNNDREHLEQYLQDLPQEFEPPPQVLGGELKDWTRLEVAIEYLCVAHSVGPKEVQIEIVNQLWELIGRWSKLSGEFRDRTVLEAAIERVRIAHRVRPEAAQIKIVDQLWELIGRWSNTPRPPHS